jgi:hypothetical protein
VAIACSKALDADAVGDPDPAVEPLPPPQAAISTAMTKARAAPVARLMADRG